MRGNIEGGCPSRRARGAGPGHQAGGRASDELVGFENGKIAGRSTRAAIVRTTARDAIAHCVRAAWPDRWSRKLPGEYAIGTESSNRPHVKGIMNTDFGRGPGAIGDQDFKWAVERNACCFLTRPAARWMSRSAPAPAETRAAALRPGSRRVPSNCRSSRSTRSTARACAQGYCAVRTNGR
jgi:hypothetical protein